MNAAKINEIWASKTNICVANTGKHVAMIDAPTIAKAAAQLVQNGAATVAYSFTALKQFEAQELKTHAARAAKIAAATGCYTVSEAAPQVIDGIQMHDKHVITLTRIG